MADHFAPAERQGQAELEAEIELVSQNPVMSGLLHSISGLLAILNEHRQIVALNDSFLEVLGVDDPGETLGLRPGEAISCVHARDEPGGCGTTRHCSTCGAAIAIVSSLSADLPDERLCALSATRGGLPLDVAFLVRSHPIRIDGKRFLLLFLQDVTRQQQRAALERTFFHDVNNMLNMLVQASELLVVKQPSALSSAIRKASLRLAQEVAIQRALLETEGRAYRPLWHAVSVHQVVEELESFFQNHPAARGRRIEYPEACPEVSLKTDLSLLLRVLCNMLINALEATEENGLVKLWLEQEGQNVSFCVWNRKEIPEEVAYRVFQRNFSTKEQAGRGIGTYSMKLFGETILGGRVHFRSARGEGTVFRFDCPVSGRAG